MLRLLDLFCGAGGAAMGYHMAGFEVVGVDIVEQPNFPFRFFQGDFESISPDKVREQFDAVHASPPCQAYSVTKSLSPHIDHPELIPPTRELLERIGLPYVIENVPGAPLLDPVVLCGSSFGLRVRRHRLFETSFAARGLGCNHGWQERHTPYKLGISQKRAAKLYGHPQPPEGRFQLTGVMPVFGGTQLKGGGDDFYAAVAMGIDWMEKKELNQAIPPAYTYFLGRQLAKEIA